VFMDTTELGPGPWAEQLRTAIKGATDFLILVNSDTEASSIIGEEATYALSLDKGIVPIVQDGYAPSTDAKPWLVTILTHQAARLDVLDPVVSCDRLVALLRGKPAIQYRLSWKLATPFLAAALITAIASTWWTSREPSSSPAHGLTPRDKEALPALSDRQSNSVAHLSAPSVIASSATLPAASRPEQSTRSKSVPAPTTPSVTSPKPSARPSERFNFHNGYFVHEKGTTWFEYHAASAGPQPFTSYREYHRDQTHIYLEDSSRSRPESATPGDHMLVRLPIDGGRFEWTWRSEDQTWRPLHLVQSTAR
jgi:hypothetical protein